MDKIKNSPFPLRQKMLLSALIGAVCLLVGGAMFMYTKDKVMLYLSIAVLFFCSIKCINLFFILRDKRYDVIEGTCTAIVAKPLRKVREVEIIDSAGINHSLYLNKQSKIKIGQAYRFYFKQTENILTENGYFDTALNSDSFLGYELIR